MHIYPRMRLNVNHEFQKLIPPLAEEEYSQLEKNILEEGCQEPIQVWKGCIVDGHNRYAICVAHSVPFKTKELSFENKDQVVLWIINHQFGRRNLSAYDRTVLALRKEEIFKESARINLKKGGRPKEIKVKGLENRPKVKTIPVNTRDEVSKLALVSSGTVKKVKVIEAGATNEVKAKIRAGEMSIDAAYKTLRQAERKESGIDYVSSLDRRIVFYPHVNIFKMHIANSSEHLYSRSKMTDEIIEAHYKAMSQTERDKLLRAFDKMTPEQIENTKNMDNLK